MNKKLYKSFILIGLILASILMVGINILVDDTLKLDNEVNDTSLNLYESPLLELKLGTKAKFMDVVSVYDEDMMEYYDMPKEVSHASYDISAAPQIITNIPECTTINELLSIFKADTTKIKVYDQTNTLVDPSWYDGFDDCFMEYYVGTGFMIEYYNNGTSLSDAVYVAITGDIDGNGMADAYDYALIGGYIRNSAAVDRVKMVASDIDRDGMISAADISYLFYHLCYYNNGLASKPDGSTSDMFEGFKPLIDEHDQTQAVLISAGSIEINEAAKTGTLTVANASTSHNFSDVVVSQGATWVLALPDLSAEIPNVNLVGLTEGNNKFMIVVTSEDSTSIVYYAITIRRRPMCSVTFNTNGGTAISPEAVEEGESLNGTFSSVKQGYTYDGLSYNGTKITLPYQINENITLDVLYTPKNDTPYVVEHYKQNVNDDEYSLCETENMTGTTDANSEATAMNYIGFKAPTIVQQKIKADGTTVVKAYYDREVYQIDYQVVSTIAAAVKKVPAAKSYRYGYSLEFEAKANPGYEVVSYEVNGGTVMPPYIVTENATIQVTYAACTNTAYKVEHYLQDLASATSYTLKSTDSKYGETAQNTAATAKTFTGFTPKSFVQSKIAGDGTTVVKIYYTRNTYNITFTTASPEMIDSLPGDTTCKYDGSITFEAAAKDGYEIVCYKVDGATVSSPYTVKANTTITVEAVAKTGTAYTVKHYLQNLNDSSYTLKDTQKFYGSTGEQTTASALTYTGFTANAFAQKAIDGDGTTLIEIQYTRNEYDVHFSMISTSLEEFKTIPSDRKAKYGESIEFEAEMNPGYILTNYTVDGYVVSSPYTVTDDTDIKIEFMTAPSAKYTVKHMKMDLNGTTYTLAEQEELYLPAGMKTAAAAKAYEGFTAGAFTQQDIKSDGTTEIVINYDRNMYTFTYKWKDSTTHICSDTYYYGQSVLVNPTLNSLYSYNYWIDYYDDSFVSYDLSFTYVMQASDKTIWLSSFRIQTKVYLNVRGEYYDSYEQYVTNMPNLNSECPVDWISGYELEGWYLDQAFTKPIVVGADLYTITDVYAKLKRIDEYEIGYDNCVYYGWYPTYRWNESSLSELYGTASEYKFIPKDLSKWSHVDYIGDDGNFYLYYLDVDTNSDGVYDYRGVYFTQYLPYRISKGGAVERQNFFANYVVGNIYWFSYSQIRWIAAAEENGDTYLTTDQCIDARIFNYPSNEMSSFTDSSISKWLNDDFYNVAFGVEAKYLAPTFDGNLITLSQENVISPKGDDRNSDYSYATDYSQILGACYADDGHIPWWCYWNGNTGVGPLVFKNPDYMDDAAPSIYTDFTYGVKPVINFNVGKKTVYLDYSYSGIIKTISTFNMYDIPKLTRDGYIFEGWYFDKEYKKPVGERSVVCKNTTLYAKWTKKAYEVTTSGISFGRYPQSLVQDEAIINQLTSLQGVLPTIDSNWIAYENEDWTSYNYHRTKSDLSMSDYTFNNFYKDIDLDGDGLYDYRGIYCPYVSRMSAIGNYSDVYDISEGKLVYGNVYWFKYEPISWEITNYNEADGYADLRAELAIDAQNYGFYDESYGYTKYSYSYIYEWLNETFYSTFTASEKECMTKFRPYSTYNYGSLGYPFEDYVGMTTSFNRTVIATAYAKAQGMDEKHTIWLLNAYSSTQISVYTNSGSEECGSCSWLTYRENVITNILGVIPTIRIKI